MWLIIRNDRRSSTPARVHTIIEPMDGSQGSAFHDFVSETCAGRITPDLLERFERVTGRKPHRLLRRGIVSCHRDLEIILDKHERKEPFYIFTGRGPSSDSLHLGHSIPFELAKYVSSPIPESLN